MRKFNLNLFVLSLIFASSLYAAQCEHILLFDADIQVLKDGSMEVNEEITVQSCGIQIKHGIVREFPTTYKDEWGAWYVVDFKIKQVQMNGKPINYHVKKERNGEYIYIGQKGRHLSPGVYIFTIIYTTNRQLGIFENHDELYWNVTGNGWRLPIDKVTARVSLPQGVDINEIKVHAYTGFFGDKGKDVEAYVTRNGIAKFNTTRPFAPYEGLSIVVGWPKGSIAYPSMLQKLIWFVRDNGAFGIIGFLILFLLSLFFYTYRQNKKRKGNKPVIPLFYPPEDMTPGMINYIMKMGYKDAALAAEIVNMAVHGWLKIKYADGGFFYRNVYTLIKESEEGIEKYPMYQAIYQRLFRGGDTFKIGPGNSDTLQRIRAILENNYTELDGLFNLNNPILVIAAVSIGVCGVSIGLLNYDLNYLIILGFAVFILTIFVRFLYSYTIEGFALKREIEGFKLFLSTTEKERMKLIGTPPTKTPALYEKYLPYAMALGVEEQWNKQFTPIFERLKQDGHTYMPIWYVGPGLHGFSSTAFSSHLSSNISSAAGRPGRSSGFGGSGSGGGGGGGGGGGW